MFDLGAIIAAVSAIQADHLSQGDPLQQHLQMIAHQQNTNAINNPQEWTDEPSEPMIQSVCNNPMMDALMKQLEIDRGTST